MSYVDNIKYLFINLHPDVKCLLDPSMQKRKFPKKTFQNFLKKKKIRALIKSELPIEITRLLESKKKLDLIPTKIFRSFFAENEIWGLFPENFTKAIEGDFDPKIPTQDDSDFTIHRELGDWAEVTVAQAIDQSMLDLQAVRYGRRDCLIAGENGFAELFLEHRTELKLLGKRPDLLIYRAGNVPMVNFDHEKAEDLLQYAQAALAGFEVRSSQQAIDTDTRAEKLSFTPKIEDLNNVIKWIEVHKVPHFYVQVLFGRAYAISFKRILELLAERPNGPKYRIDRVARNQFKSTIYIPLKEGVRISSEFVQPTQLNASIKELPTGRVVILVKFSGGKIVLDQPALTQLLGLEDATS